MQPCPLCHTENSDAPIRTMDGRRFYRCFRCLLLFVDRGDLPRRETEKHRYQQHRNGIEYPGYVAFLNRAIAPALSYLDTDMTGVDYGCGPTPTLSLLLRRRGIACDDYDPFFYPKICGHDADFVFATECIEHFFNPAVDMKTIHGILRPGGYLITMTHQWTDSVNLSTWHYANDITHVAFYHPRTMAFIATQLGFSLLENIDNRVSIFQKK